MDLFFYYIKIQKKRETMDIKAYMTQDHLDCDETFAQMENVASKEGLPATKEIFDKFADEMEHHFQMEERVLFPMFEQKTGMTQGPTEMMRQEHTQMRALIKQLSSAQSEANLDKFFGLTETFMILVQQHNMKEEQMLYTMIQQHMQADNDTILEMMQSMITQ